MTLYTLPLLATATVSGIVAVLAWRRRPSPGARAFSVIMLLIILNVLVSLFLLGSTTLDSFLFWVKMSFVGGGLSVAWLVFALRYDGDLCVLSPALVFLQR